MRVYAAVDVVGSVRPGVSGEIWKCIDVYFNVAARVCPRSVCSYLAVIAVVVEGACVRVQMLDPLWKCLRMCVRFSSV